MLKVRTLFSGIGSPEMALRDLGIPYELVDFCEIDKYAVKSYCAIHGTDIKKNHGDITKINEKKLEHANLLVWGFPCQDLSVAGKMRGLTDENGNKTRSGLLYDALRILQATMPEYSVCENVKALVSKKFDKEFKQLLAELEFYGYNNYYKVINAKDQGIPQNRERVFLVSIRKDVDNGTFKFPESIPLELRLKDMLEQEVDEKYYLNQKMVDQFKATMPQRDSDMVSIGQVSSDGSQAGKVYSPDGLFPTLCGTTHGYAMGNIAIKTANSKGYDVAVDGDSINLQFPNSKTRRGRVGHQVAQTLETACNQGVLEQPKIVEDVERTPLKFLDRNGKKFDGNYAFCVDTVNTGGVKEHYTDHTYRIRKLTPLECWKLMGFTGEDFYKAKAVNSDTQLYKQAGNSICKQVLMAIFKNLLR